MLGNPSGFTRSSICTENQLRGPLLRPCRGNLGPGWGAGSAVLPVSRLRVPKWGAFLRLTSSTSEVPRFSASGEGFVVGVLGLPSLPGDRVSQHAIPSAADLPHFGEDVMINLHPDLRRNYWRRRNRLVPDADSKSRTLPLCVCVWWRWGPAAKKTEQIKSKGLAGVELDRRSPESRAGNLELDRLQAASPLSGPIWTVWIWTPGGSPKCSPTPRRRKSTIFLHHPVKFGGTGSESLRPGE